MVQIEQLFPSKPSALEALLNQSNLIVYLFTTALDGPALVLCSLSPLVFFSFLFFFSLPGKSTMILDCFFVTAFSKLLRLLLTSSYNASNPNSPLFQALLNHGSPAAIAYGLAFVQQRRGSVPACH